MPTVRNSILNAKRVEDSDKIDSNMFIQPGTFKGLTDYRKA